MKAILEKFNDGGPVFTYTILVLLLLIIVLFVKAFLKCVPYPTVSFIDPPSQI